MLLPDSVYVQPDIIIGSLPIQALPAVESRQWHAIPVPHMQFPKETGGITGSLEVFREENQSVGQRCGIVYDSMLM